MRTYYGVTLARTERTLRVALYEPDKEGVLTPVWGRLTGDLDIPPVCDLPYQVFVSRPKETYRDKYPACHFRITGYGYNKEDKLCEALAQHFKEPVTLLWLNGWHPSRTVAEYSPVAQG